MTSISSKILSSILLAFTGLAGVPVVASAQQGQHLSVSPTLFEMAASPTQEWRSSIKIVNPNPYELTIYVEAVNFAPRGEEGEGMLLPVLESEQTGATLAEWIEYSHEPVVIAAEKTAEVPFLVRVPPDATPGGHFAAFMVGTRPPASPEGATQLRTAQVVTSLFFVRIAGEVAEDGVIREFRTTERLYSKPAADFELRFENNGNVHLRPQGDIQIYNMWGQERGLIPINRQSHFGNVLPDSIRKFTFSWRGEWSLSDMGRYRAVVTLAYGQDERRFVTSTTYFWVIPLLPLAVGLLVLGSLIGAIVWLVRLYVRSMLARAGFDTNHTRSPLKRPAHRVRAGDIKIDAATKQVVITPTATVAASRTPVWSGFGQRVYQWVALFPMRDLISSYWRLIAGAVLVVILLVLIGMYVMAARTPQRSYEVTYVGEEQSTSVTSDQILYEQQREATDLLPEAPVASSTISIVIINKSGQAGAGADVALALEKLGYEITEVTTDLENTQGRTVIVYKVADTEAALGLSKVLNNALLSAYAEESSEEPAITIHLGSDLELPL